MQFRESAKRIKFPDYQNYFNVQKTKFELERFCTEHKQITGI